MKKSLFIIIVLVIGLLIVSMAQAQSITMYNFSTGLFMWDAPANPKTPAGVTIPGTIKYQVWNKNTVPAITGVKIGGEILPTQLLMTFPPFIESYPGVQAVFYATIAPTIPQSSGISWSTDVAVCANGVTFGILYLPTIDMIKNLRMISS